MHCAGCLQGHGSHFPRWLGLLAESLPRNYLGLGQLPPSTGSTYIPRLVQVDLQSSNSLAPRWDSPQRPAQLHSSLRRPCGQGLVCIRVLLHPRPSSAPSLPYTCCSQEQCALNFLHATLSQSLSWKTPAKTSSLKDEDSSTHPPFLRCVHSPFSMSASLFLPCKEVPQYHFLDSTSIHEYAIFVFVFVTCFPLCDKG